MHGRSFHWQGLSPLKHIPFPPVNVVMHAHACHKCVCVLGAAFDRHLTLEVTLELCWDYLWQCWSWEGSIDTQLWKSLCNFTGITFWQCWSWGGQLTLNLGSHFATLLGLPLTMLIQGVGVDQHSTWEVTLQLCWDYLWQCWSLGGVNWHSTLEVTLQLCWDYLWQC